MTDAPEIHPERVKLTDLVAFAAKRVRRAQERLSAAEVERHAADRALANAEMRLSDWIEANPDPQLELI